MDIEILHHGAVNGVTGSCHQLMVDAHSSVLIDCGLFQGDEQGNGSDDALAIEFDISTVCALIVTHVHIDHVGRIPYLFAAGFDGPVYCSKASAQLLPLVIEDALKVGVTRDEKLITSFLALLKRHIIAVDFNDWVPLALNNHTSQLTMRLQRAGHILGSSYVELDVAKNNGVHRVMFSGDLGAPYTPLLPSPKSPYRADTLVIESTYGDKLHEGRKTRTRTLQRVIEKAVADNGVVLIPAFSIGRTQELLYELEQIIHNEQKHYSVWQTLNVIVDSPMAANFTAHYLQFKALWDNEAKQRLKHHRHPLDFSQLITIDSHNDHLKMIRHLTQANTPAIVIAASGMCSGGRITNYLSAFLANPTADVIFVGYQAAGTVGRQIQKYRPRNGYVLLNNEKVTINAGVHTISGYSAHADQKDLVNFVKRIKRKPSTIKIVHGDDDAKEALKQQFKTLLPQCKVVIPDGL